MTILLWTLMIPFGVVSLIGILWFLWELVKPDRDDEERIKTEGIYWP